MICSRARPACLLCFCVLIFAIAPPLFAQEDLGKFEKQLEQLHRDQYLSIDPSEPADRRAATDLWRQFVTFSYSTLDDQKTTTTRCGKPSSPPTAG